MKVRCNFIIEDVTRYKTVDLDNRLIEFVYDIRIALTDGGEVKEYATCDSELENGEFLKKNPLLHVYGDSRVKACRWLTEKVTEAAHDSDKYDFQVMGCGWFCYENQYVYVGRNGCIREDGFTQRIRCPMCSNAPELKYPIESDIETRQCIKIVNRLLDYSFEDRIIFISGLQALLENLVLKKNGFRRTSLILVGKRQSCKTTLVKSLIGLFGGIPEISSLQNIKQCGNSLRMAKDQCVLMDDLALESKSKDKAVIIMTDIIQSYFDKKSMVSGNIFQAKPVITTEKILGRSSVIERSLLVDLNGYREREGVEVHLNELAENKTVLEQVVATFLRWCVRLLNAGKFNQELDIVFEQSRDILGVPTDSLRIRINIQSLYAFNELWIRFCRSEGEREEFSPNKRIEWDRRMAKIYSDIVLLSTTREEQLKFLAAKILKEEAGRILFWDKESSPDIMSSASIDTINRELGVFISDCNMLYPQSRKRLPANVLLLNLDAFTREINQLYDKYIPYSTGSPFRCQEVKTKLAFLRWAYFSERSDKKGQNYVINWPCHSEDILMGTDSLIQGDMRAISDLLVEINQRNKKIYSGFKPDFQNVIVINADKVGCDIRKLKHRKRNEECSGNNNQWWDWKRCFSEEDNKKFDNSIRELCRMIGI